MIQGRNTRQRGEGVSNDSFSPRLGRSLTGKKFKEQKMLQRTLTRLELFFGPRNFCPSCCVDWSLQFFVEGGKIFLLNRFRTRDEFMHKDHPHNAFSAYVFAFGVQWLFNVWSLQVKFNPPSGRGCIPRQISWNKHTPTHRHTHNYFARALTHTRTYIHTHTHTLIAHQV